MASGARGRAPDPAAVPALTAALDWLPIASLLLAEDGSAVEVNEAWTDFSGVQAGDSLRYGWLDAIKPADRALLTARLRGAAASGRAGSADFQLEHAAGGRLSRWWWRPGPAGRLLLCAVRLDNDVPEGDGKPWHPAASQTWAMRETSVRLARPGEDARTSGEPDAPPLADADLAQLVVHRLFGVGLVLESAIGVTEGRGQHWLREAIDELDALIRDVRTALFAQSAGHHLDGR